MNTFQPGTAALAPATQVEISVSCRNLADQDTFSKSDPMCVLRVGDFRTKQFHEHGRTEMIKDCLNPQFVKKFIISYLFEERQMLKFEIYDVDSPSQRLDAHDFLGSCECSLGELVSAGGKYEKKLQGRATGRGIICLRAEEVSTSKEEVTLSFKASHLDKKDFFGKSDPFLVFYRANEDGSYTVAHKTEVIKNNLNPTWRPFVLPIRTLCNGDYDRSIKVECFDWDSDGSHDLIGEIQTNMRELSKGPGTSNVYPVIHPHKKAKKKSYKNSGVIELLTCKIQQQHSFIDFLKGGMQMNFTVAIDFTASNGNPSQPTSLHYFHPYQPNQYAAAIQAVGEIIQDYDSDKQFPVLGFGAKLRDGSVSHEFALNFNPSNPYVQGIQGILQHYYGALQQVQLYGPTNFAPVINHVARFAAASANGSNYFVLLIITDGVITDMPNTVEAIVKASGLPMSIIIIGVGNAEFDAMDLLDADNQRLCSHGRYAERDIVQFVPFREFIGGKYGSDISISKAYLAKEVLAEVPDQVTLFMKKKGIKPQPPRDNVNIASDTTAASYAGGPSPQRNASYHGGPQPSGNVPYQGGAPPPGNAPYPGGPPSAGSAPYSGGPAPAGSAPYPGGPFPGVSVQYPGGPPPRGSAPYSGGSLPAGNNSYSGSQPPAGTAPYPGGPQAAGGAPYPGGSQAAGGAPYPGGPQSAGGAPYPGGPPAPGTAAYPGGPPPGGNAPYLGRPPVPARTAPPPSYTQVASSRGSAPYPGAAQLPYPRQ